MKKRAIYPLILILAAAFTACEVDNFEAPSTVIQGTLYDAQTGKPLQLEQGKNHTRIMTEELSWNDGDFTPFYLAVKQDGSYYNNKMFDAEYRISPIDGPFIPVLLRDGGGNIVADNRKIVRIKGSGVIDFELEPFLRVEYAGAPVVNADNTLTVKFRFTKGTSNEFYTIAPFLDCQLFISPNPYVGNNNYDGKLVGAVVTEYNGKSGDELAGEEISITTVKPLGSAQGARAYYIRVGARVNDSSKRYNYTPVKKVSVPKL